MDERDEAADVIDEDRALDSSKLNKVAMTNDGVRCRIDCIKSCSAMLHRARHRLAFVICRVIFHWAVGLLS